MTDAQEVNVQKQEVVEPVENEQNKENAQPDKGSKEYNWRQLEQKNKQLEQSLYEMKLALDKSVSKKETPEEDFNSLQDDDLLTISQAKKLAERQAREIVKQELQKIEKEALPRQVKSQYTDYDQVVTPENIEQLIKEDPDLEYDIQVSKNPYARAYKEIKRASFFKAKHEKKAIEEKIEDNLSKPLSSNSLGQQRPLSLANDYAKGSPELLEEMIKYRGGSI